MPFENMFPGLPPQQPNWDAPFVDARLAPPEQMPPPDRMAGIDARRPEEVAADAQTALAYKAAQSVPRAIAPLGRAVVENVAPLASFPQLFGGSDKVVTAMRAANASDKEIRAELLRLLDYQRDLMGLPIGVDE